MMTAFFSILAPGKHIPPHRGPYKGLLRYHLGLQVHDVAGHQVDATGTKMDPPPEHPFLRTTRKAIYAMVERGALPGVVRVGRRLLVRRLPLGLSGQFRRDALRGDRRVRRHDGRLRRPRQLHQYGWKLRLWKLPCRI